MFLAFFLVEYFCFFLSAALFFTPDTWLGHKKQFCKRLLNVVSLCKLWLLITECMNCTLAFCVGLSIKSDIVTSQVGAELPVEIYLLGGCATESMVGDKKERGRLTNKAVFVRLMGSPNLSVLRGKRPLIEANFLYVIAVKGNIPCPC